MAVVWYRSAVIVGLVFINASGETELLNVETFMFTMGKGVYTAAKAMAAAKGLGMTVEAYTAKYGKRIPDQVKVDEMFKAAKQIEEDFRTGVKDQWIRIFIVGEELFTPTPPAESAGLGAYNVGVRIEDGKIMAKAYIGYRLPLGAIFGKVLESVERAKQKFWGLFG